MSNLFFVFRYFGFRAGFTYLYDSFKRKQINKNAQLTMPTNKDQQSVLVYYSNTLH